MKERRAARRLALDVLYEAEIREMLPIDTFRDRQRLGWGVDDADEPEAAVLHYARRLVEGVQEHQADADELIVRYADRWAIERMPIIDKNLLRMALFELLWGDKVPVAVAINEAVELAKEYSTEYSGRFVNGVLGKIADELPQVPDSASS